MGTDRPQAGRDYYFVKFNPELKHQGGEFNLNNYVVYKARLIKVTEDSYLIQNDQLETLELKNTLLFNSKDEAEKYKLHLSF
ncbi:hypothetical protein [Desulforamulus aquiferis]|uniref:Uncharacterized protein n=1 Tax=Desulforamulus aquiferis TaxID=1397668 RepID=A0AAW7ZET8_9FIRM|nr:hypothetical protein [Desulforamulus aquiferis]MDO7787792.1 hypothetical protein [Desulforamulus aquiferis]RYD05369.1 hypothetical protein N752_09740 [Desulforamulus aquiferis]